MKPVVAFALAGIIGGGGGFLFALGALRPQPSRNTTPSRSRAPSWWQLPLSRRCARCMVTVSSPRPSDLSFDRPTTASLGGGIEKPPVPIRSKPVILGCSGSASGSNASARTEKN